MSVEQLTSKEVLEMASGIGLTQREFKVILSIGLRGLSSPSEIADAAGVPRSKIYEVLEILSSPDKRILQLNGSKYSLLPSAIKDIRNNYEKNSNDFKKLLRYLETYVTPVEPYMQIIKRNLNDLFTELRYDISAITLPEDRNIRAPQFIRRNIERLSQQVQLVATSRDSGNKVAVIFIDSKIFKRMDVEIIYSLTELENFLGIHTVFLIYSPDLSTEIIEMIKRRGRSVLAPDGDEVMPSRFRNRPFFIVCSLSELTDTKMKQVAEYFTQFDERWRHSKRDLQHMSGPLENLKRSLAVATTTVSESRYEIDRSTTGSEYTDLLKEVIDRVGADLKAYEESFKSLANEYDSLLNNLEDGKILPSEKIISELSNRIDDLNESISNSNKELNTIREEIDYFKKDDERYKQYGFRINPFIFTVPFSSPSEMVDQQQAKRSFDMFIRKVESGSENRTLVIADEFGKGKTHLMYYFKKQIIDKKYGRILPLYIKCPPRYPEVDIIDLYSKILLEISKQWEGIDEKLVKKVYEILSKSTPRDTNEFILKLRNILAQTYEYGYSRMVLMIDEFENMLPENTPRLRPRTESNPRTLLQLKSMMEIQDIAFVFAIRKATWDSWQEKLLPVLDNKDIEVINLERLNELSTAELIMERMNLKKNGWRDIEFSNEAIKEIVTLSDGIPRNIVKHAREALRIAVLNDKYQVEKVDVLSNDKTSTAADLRF